MTWFVFAAIMHLVLSIIHLITWIPESLNETSPATYRSLQLVAVLFETLNLCMMLQLFGTSIVNGLEISPEATKFQIWIVCEILVALSTVITSTIYLCFRSINNWN